MTVPPYSPAASNTAGSSYPFPAVEQIPVPGRSTEATPYGSPSARNLLLPQRNIPKDDTAHFELMTDEQKAEILRRHLPSTPGARSTSGASNRSATPADEAPINDSHFSLQGGDVTHELYKWQQQVDKLPLKRSRSQSMTSHHSDPHQDPKLDYRGMREPGGFRRNFIHRKIAVDTPQRPQARFTKSFVDFLSLYGHFGGEMLEEIDEDDEYEGMLAEEDLNEVEAQTRRRAESLQQEQDERAPLLKQSKMREKKQQGDATVTQAVLMLLKSFVGTGVLFLGKAFCNGGILFSTIVLLAVAMISLYAFLLLVRTRLVVHGSFGEIGGILYGPSMRHAILFSIALSQIGFVTAYTIFVAQNLQAFVTAISGRTLSIGILIAVQLVMFLPLALIRNIQKLSGTALIADAFILIGLIYIFINEIKEINTNGVKPVALFNSADFPLLIGTAVFSFEGIGLVIPITESMKEPHRFPAVLSGVMVGVAILFAGAGVLGYMAYGQNIQTVVLVNLPQDDRFVNVVQLLYSIAIVLSTPLQLFPAVRIMENGIFPSTKSGKHSLQVKWTKNVFRIGVVIICALISWIGAADLDKFVSLIGSVACVPLCFCYPALLHWKACADTQRKKVQDALLFIFGTAAAIYTTFQTCQKLFNR